MAVNKVSQREIVEVPYQLPDGSIEPRVYDGDPKRVAK